VVAIAALEFEIIFHGPFRVGTGWAGRGADITVDRRSPLKASSLKGVMRASAELLLGGQHGLVREVFGHPWDPSPWSWSSARVLDARPERQARVEIDRDRHVAVDHALLIAEEIWAAGATFEVHPLRKVANRRAHELVLMAAAHGVHSLGEDRRRGLGWVTVRAHEPVFDEAAFDELLGLGILTVGGSNG